MLVCLPACLQGDFCMDPVAYAKVLVNRTSTPLPTAIANYYLDCNPNTVNPLGYAPRPRKKIEGELLRFDSSHTDTITH